jgi:glycosyltransferase involved in cell wall biosynthesis
VVIAAGSRERRPDAAAEQPLVSVIVSTRNRASKTQAMLESLLQSDAWSVTWEAVVADNDSTDETAQLLKDYAERYSGRVRYVHQSTPAKTTGLNIAIRHARGSLIALLDDDVRVAPDWLSNLIAAYRSDPELAGFGGRVELFNPDDAPVAVRRSTVERVISGDSFDPCSIPVIGCNLSFRRNILARLGEFDEAFGPGSIVGCADDMDLLYRAYRLGCKLKYLPNVLVFHDHGRKRGPDTETTTKRFLRGRGGFYLKYGMTDQHILKCLCRESASLLAAAMRDLLKGRLRGEALGELRAMAGGAWAFARSRLSPLRRPVTVQIYPAADIGISQNPPTA